MKKHILFSNDAVPNGGQGYFPADIQKLYHFPIGLTGAGQTIGILEFSNGYNLRDATAFWRMHGITPPQVTFVSVDGTPNDGGLSPDDEEATLDLQWAGALAPGARIVVYEANGGSTYAEFAAAVTRTLQFILHDTQHHPTVLSISYGDAESSFDPADLQQWAPLVEQLDAKGITVCISSGDQGAYGLHDPNGPRARHADAPATIPFAVAVGGTSLQPDGAETAWTYQGPQNGGATGGGFSSQYAKPAYQSGISGNGRGVPDISCNADPATGYQIIFQGQPAVVGGTSVSCPVFAALVALANERRASQRLAPISRLAEVLYETLMHSAYHDITSGNNSYNGVTGYAAVPGWDACTGFGSFDASQLVADLSQAGVGTVLQPQPATPPEPAPQPTLTRSAGDPLPPPPSGDHAFLVRVEAVIQQVEPDVHLNGAAHHHLLVKQVQVQKVWNGTQMDVSDAAFVAIRYGDNLGLPGPIPNLAAGKTITLQGRYVPTDQAYPGGGNPGDAVIDETHHPFGFVLYDGQIYR